MTEIVMLVWLGDVARSVSFMLAMLLVVGLATVACIVVLDAGDGREPSRGLVWSAALVTAIPALALALIPSRDTIYLYAAARAVQIAETTELGGEVYAALLRSLREVSPAK